MPDKYDVKPITLERGKTVTCSDGTLLELISPQKEVMIRVYKPKFSISSRRDPEHRDEGE